MARFSGKKSFIQIIVAGAIVLLLTGVGLTGVLVFSLSPSRLKPTLEHAATQAWGAELKIAELKYSRFFPVRVVLTGIDLRDSGGVEMLTAPSAEAGIPLKSLLEGKPELSLRFERPRVRVERRSDAVWNWSRQVGNSNVSASTVTIPLIFSRARLAVELTGGEILIRGPSHADYGWTDLEARISGDEIPGPVSFEASGRPLGVGPQDAVWGGQATLRGRLVPTASVSASGSRVPIAAVGFQADFDLTKTELESAEWKIKKVAGSRVTLETTGTISGNRWSLDQILLKLPAGEVRGSAELRAGNHLEARFRSSALEVAKYAEIFPALGGVKTGNLSWTSEIRGPLDHLEYSASAQLRGFSGNWPGFRAVPVVEADVEIRNDRVESLVATVQAPGTEITLQGSFESISGRVAKLDLIAKEVDLDRLVEQPGFAVAGIVQAVAVAGISGSIGIRASSAALGGAKLEDVRGKLTFREGAFVADGFSARLGSAGELRWAVESGLERGKTVARVTARKCEMGGFRKLLSLPEDLGGLTDGSAEFRATDVLGDWDGQGEFLVSNPTLGALDPAQPAGAAVVEYLKSRGEKQGAGRIKLAQKSSFAFMSGEFQLDSKSKTLALRKLRGAKPAGAAMDLEGHLSIRLPDGVISSELELVDRRGASGARRFLRELVAAEDRSLRIPLELGCTVSSPCLSFSRLMSKGSPVAAVSSPAGKRTQSVMQSPQQNSDEASVAADEDFDNILLLQDALKSRMGRDQNPRLEDR